MHLQRDVFGAVTVSEKSFSLSIQQARAVTLVCSNRCMHNQTTLVDIYYTLPCQDLLIKALITEPLGSQMASEAVPHSVVGACVLYY